MKIEDNFLQQEEFDKIQKLMMEPSSFPWFYNNRIVFEEDVDDKFQFIHLFYKDYSAQSLFCENLKPILEIIQPISLWRIKANLQVRTPEIVESTFHVDIPLLEENLKQWTTSIFYINTNNGYTKFEDGTIAESVANRMITFPANMKHCGTSCTDERTRIVINFNYFENT